MKIVICGMNGFVGSALEHYFSSKGDTVVPLSIRSSTTIESIVPILDNADVVINLAGANILGRWTKEYKALLRSSRLETTNKLVEGLSKCAHSPRMLLNASAVGIYDADHQHDEYSRHFSHNFLSTLVQDWEAAAMKAKNIGVRVCAMRFGVVYGIGGGAMEKMLVPFKLGLGGKMGDGFQMISWIHIDDLVRACDFLIQNESIQGAVNFTAPELICNLQQTKKMGQYLHRPTFMSMPAWLVKVIFGEGSVVMLESKEAYPRILQDAGFVFTYPKFDSAMEQIVHAQG